MMQVLREGRDDRELETVADLGPTGRILEGILLEAIDRRASDLHLDPVQGRTRVRYRVDGFFTDGDAVATDHDRLIARLKVLAGLTVYRRDQIQEGSIRRPGGVDVRVSIVPTVAGEKATLRVFDPGARPFRLEDLGFAQPLSDLLRRLAGMSTGLIAAAGPAGSGKTTTLYALLDQVRRLRGDYVNICSVEDPVEFALEGVHQIQVNREKGLTFARGLAALLRQDPEVLLVGEIRDPETAAIAVEAGLTGHLVLTSVHAGSAAEALTRLRDLGIEGYALAGALRGIMAQRLVRRVCRECSGSGGPARRASGPPEPRPAPLGPEVCCSTCRGTGFHGRLPLAEAALLDRSTAVGLVAGTGPGEVPLAGGITMSADGMERTRNGETTAEEVRRVLGDTE